MAGWVTMYVDPLHGDDAADGLSADSPKQTIDDAVRAYRGMPAGDDGEPLTLLVRYMSDNYDVEKTLLAKGLRPYGATMGLGG